MFYRPLPLSIVFYPSNYDLCTSLVSSKFIQMDNYTITKYIHVVASIKRGFQKLSWKVYLEFCFQKCYHLTFLPLPMKIKKKLVQNTTSFKMQLPIYWSSSSITNQHPMGVNCASLNVDFGLHSYESWFIQTLVKDKNKQQKLQPLIFSAGIL